MALREKHHFVYTGHMNMNLHYMCVCICIKAHINITNTILCSSKGNKTSKKSLAIMSHLR